MSPSAGTIIVWASENASPASARTARLRDGFGRGIDAG